MKSINTLIPDVYELLQSKGGWFSEQLSQELSADIASRLSEQLGENTQKPTLRLSKMGDRCPRALWYSIHHPELAEAIPPWATFKYSFGHVIEALAVALAKAAGHTVTGVQDAIVLDGITGHRDCVIDGCIVDVKSASSRSFIKFKSRSIAQDDPFGYLDQLDGYVVGSYLDPLVSVKDRGYLWAIDKTLGHMVLYEHVVRESSIRNRIKEYKGIVSKNEPPACTCRTIPQGASGNLQLDVQASYSPFKHCCFPLLRTFLYATGPVFLTRVVRLPEVKEITRHKRIDNVERIAYN